MHLYLSLPQEREREGSIHEIEVAIFHITGESTGCPVLRSSQGFHPPST